MKQNNKSELIELLTEFKGLGVVKGGELCLPPDIALKFLDRLETIGIGVLGLDGWYSSPGGGVAQDLNTDISVPKDILSDSNNVVISIGMVRNYILNQLDKDVDFVSLTLNIKFLWKDLFPTGSSS